VVVLAAVAMFAGTYFLIGAMTQPLPDVTPPTQSGGASSSAYALVSVTITLQGSNPCVNTIYGQTVACTLTISQSAAAINVHEVLTHPAQGATIFKGLGLTFGEDCHAKVKMSYATPDYSGVADSSETLFTFGSPFVVKWGNMNMYHTGLITMSFDTYVKGCSAQFSSTQTNPLADWTKIPGSGLATQINFDGVDGS